VPRFAPPGNWWKCLSSGAKSSKATRRFLHRFFVAAAVVIAAGALQVSEAKLQDLKSTCGTSKSLHHAPNACTLLHSKFLALIFNPAYKSQKSPVIMIAFRRFHCFGVSDEVLRYAPEICVAVHKNRQLKA
jgi:hypothetical protein